ncbi:MAG: ATP-binding protein [Bacteroidota bacterium]
MFNRPIHIVFIHLLLLVQHLSGQEFILSATTLETNNIIDVNIWDIREDPSGFVWMTTPNGIARYDGHQFKLFNTTNTPLRSILLGDKRKLVIDEDGYFWIAGENTIDLLHHATFEIIPFEERYPNVPFQGGIKRIIQTDSGTIIFLTTETKKFYKYTPENIFEPIFLPDLRNPEMFPQGDLLWIIQDNHQFFKYDLNQKTVLNEITNHNESRIFYVENFEKYDLFFKNTGNKLIFLKAHKNDFEEIATFNLETTLDMWWSKLHYLPKSDLILACLSSSGGPYSIIDIDQKSITPVSFSDNSILEYYRKSWVDQQEVVWIHNRRQIKLLKLNTNQFNLYLPFYSVRGFQVNDQYLFTKQGKVSLATGKLVKPQLLDKVVEIKWNNSDDLWYGGWDGIAQIDTGTFEISNEISSLSRIPNQGPIYWSLMQEQNDTWWGGTLGHGIYRKAPNQEMFYPFEKFNGFAPPSGAIHLLDDGAFVWAASNNGLYLIHKEKGVTARFWAGAPSSFRIPFNDIHFVLKLKNSYWITSSGNGMVRLRLNKHHEIVDLKHFTVKDGLPSNTVYCIVEDDRKRLWFSTYNGLMCLDPDTEALQVFNQKDGLTKLEFNRNSYAKGNDGRIYFGTIKGITGFHPDEVIRQSNLDIPIVITQFEIYDKASSQWSEKTVSIKNQQKIVLSPTEQFFRLNVSMLKYFDAQNIRYSYKIDGWLEEYQPLQGNTLEINGLPYGKYDLRIRGQVADGRFSDQELVLPLEVERPFYLRLWFIVMALVFVALSIVQIYYWRIQQLNQRQKELEWMVRERTAQIEKDKTVIEDQAKKLKELDEVKSRFFANISHELRTPLTLILSPLARVLRRNELTNKDFTSLKLMQQNGQKLLKRINELLDLSRLDANKLEVLQTPTFLYPLLRNIIASVDSAANAKGIQLLFEYHLNEELQVLLDVDKVEKIVFNYLSNALKFTPQNGTVTIRAERVQQLLQLCVSDTGIGILPEELGKIFDRFYQSPHVRGASGTGIGLALCRELSKVMNGKVWAESTIGKGSAFYFQIPLVETFAVKARASIIEYPNETELPIVPTPSRRSKKPTVLVVEDNTDLRNFIAGILQENYNIQTEEHGQAALSYLQAPDQPAPALIISDIMMPIMDGIKLLKAVKSDDQLRHIPMIMLTARQNMEVKLEALRIGVDDYITKPFNEIELLARVSNLIDNTMSRIEAAPVLVNGKPDNHKPKTSEADLKWLAKVEAIIVEEIANPNFVLKDIAPKVNMSYNGFQQKIKKITGLSPKKYERSIKLNKARDILKSGEVETVSEVLYRLGFDNHYHFSKIYKEEFGIMPSGELK